MPCAKIVGNECFSIINDYIGRPILAFDKNGEQIWSAEYDIYGGLKNLKGDRSFIPFRQLGQYEDVETGLYYNPETGTYISKDPICLLGGLNVYAYVWDSNTQVDIWRLSESSDLPRMKGKRINYLKKQLKDNGFTQVKYNPEINETWRHSDGSEVRIHKYGNKKETPYKSANNVHIHKQDPLGNQLNDIGQISNDPKATHISIKNPKDLPQKRGRAHGAGCK